MTIRRAKQEDKEALWSIQTQAIRRQGLSHYSLEQVDTWAGGNTHRPEMYTESIDKDVFLVADDDGRVVGFTHLKDQTGEICALYVHPDYMGRGIGRMLFERVQEETHRVNITKLYVKASLNAVEFYKKMGFISDQQIMHRFRGGMQIPCMIMSKVI
ncbi:GNAT family N-acetyltransferase [bacterium]|nr:GNAT family N-acetyltransferase [bacterium]